MADYKDKTIGKVVNNWNSSSENSVGIQKLITSRRME